jgi:hypothetical protein
MAKRLGRALIYSFLLWFVGFIWGSIVFMTPALRRLRAIPYVSTNPAISFVILFAWIGLGYLMSRSYLRPASSPASEGRALGIMFSVLNLVLDLLILVSLLKVGFSYFLSLTVWLGYLILLLVPWITGRNLEAKRLSR